MNLIGNAIKFTPHGGQITVTARQVGSAECRVSSSGPDTHSPKPESSGTGERVEVSVTDTGEGIPDEALPHIFDKFYQVQRGIQAKAKGTGLGLSIAKSLVELQGGCIRVTSQIGQGSTFTFTLPRRPMAEIHEAQTLGNTENIL
jgi:signal transduction histidine kinase